ncbi:MAG: helix-turn-helix domain-containing protein [Clostridiales bacterium]|nr:helix-turn-helix domain-containing protein [Clostridiales bacterium]
MLSYYRSFSLYRRSLNTLSAGMSLAVLLLTLLLSGVFTGALLNEAQRQAERTAAMAADNVGRLHDELLTVAAYLGNDNANINAMMFQQRHDRLREYAGGLAMRQLQSTYASISFIAVYNQNMDTLPCTASLTAASRAALKAEALTRYHSRARSDLAPMDLQLAAPEGTDPNLPSMVLIFYSPLSTERAIGAIVIGLDCRYLNSYIGALSGDERQVAILATPDGRLIAHPDQNQLLRDVSDQPYMAGVLAAQPGLGTIRREADGQDMMITYYKSARGWNYLSLIPYSVILTQVTSWRNAVLLIAAAVLALSIAYALFGARHTFLPIRRLMDGSGFPIAPGSTGADLDFLNERIAAYRTHRQHSRLMREDALRAWLQGELPPGQLPPDGEPLSAAPGERIYLALLRVDPTEAFAALAPDGQRTLLGALSDYALDSLGEGPASARAIALPPGRLALIVSAAENDDPRRLPDGLLTALHRFRGQFSQTGCAALIGPIVGAQALPNAFSAGAALLDERFYAPDDAPAVYDGAAPRDAEPRYDEQLEAALWQAIERRDEGALDESLDRFFAHCGRCRPDDARSLTRQLLGSLLERRLAQPPTADAEQLRRAAERAASMDSLFQIRAAARRLLAGWMERERDDGPDAGRRALDLAVELARRHYSDPAFSLATVADALALSPSYFNRLFRKLTGESFTAYLTGYRLHRVCALLRTTSQPLSQICRQVGLSNESYCYTLFKKVYGVTPSQYRERYRIEEGESDIIIQ